MAENARPKWQTRLLGVLGVAAVFAIGIVSYFDKPQEEVLVEEEIGVEKNPGGEQDYPMEPQLDQAIDDAARGDGATNEIPTDIPADMPMDPPTNEAPSEFIEDGGEGMDTTPIDPQEGEPESEPEPIIIEEDEAMPAEVEE